MTKAMPCPRRKPKLIEALLTYIIELYEEEGGESPDEITRCQLRTVAEEAFDVLEFEECDKCTKEYLADLEQRERTGK